MAHYLSPDRFSTKVHHAPGGQSSFSLGWEQVPPIRKTIPQVASRIEQPKMMEYESLNRSRF